MRTKWMWGTLVAVLGMTSGCSKGLRVVRDAAQPDAPPKADVQAGPNLGPETAADTTAALPPDAGADAGNPPDVRIAPSDAGVADAPSLPTDAGADANEVVWPGPDATLTIGTAPPTIDGGIYPQVYAFPGVALASHSRMFAAEPDLSFRVDEVGKLQYADLNGDGLGDLVISNGASLSFHLQQKDGAFRASPGITLAANDSCKRFVIADFDGDGLADVAMVHTRASYHDEIAIHLQTGDGFRSTPDQRIATVNDPAVTCDRTYFLAATDMSGDRRPDLVALTEMDFAAAPGPECGFDTAYAQVFSQDSTGTFGLDIAFVPRSSDASCHACAVSLATGDFTGDGAPDFAVIQYGQSSSSEGDWVGREVLTYPRSRYTIDPTQVLPLSQYLKAVSFVDVNKDGRLDILARSADWGLYGPDIKAAGFVPGLTGVFLQKIDGSFDTARTITPEGWLPAGTIEKTDAVGIDVRDIDLDGVLDLVLERRSVAEGLFRQEGGLFASTPDVEVQTVFPDWVAAAMQDVTVTYALDRGNATTTGRFNSLSYALADMNGDGRPDLIAAYQPFAPVETPDPATGVYPSYPGVHPNTYTLFRVYLQRPLLRRFVVEIQRSRVSSEDKHLRIQATLTNASSSAAENLRVRVVDASSPIMLPTTLGILSGGPDKMAEFGADWVNREENKVRGAPLGPDILIPRIEAGATLPLAIDVPVALVSDLDVRCLFLLVDPDDNTNVILKRSYDFIARN